MAKSFFEMLAGQWSAGNFVCIGLDTDYAKIPASVARNRTVCQTLLAFNQAIVAATKDIVCAYKPNLAFYVQYGSEGTAVLRDTIRHIKNIAPSVPVILDAKFADIGNTNVGYAKFAFEYLDADAVTVNPYLGGEALQPFFDYSEKGVIVLCRTSNPNAGEFQDVLRQLSPSTRIGMDRYAGNIPLYQYVAHRTSTQWNKNSNCALVVGATRPEELAEVRAIVGDMPILIPGIGAQGGDLAAAVKAGKDSRSQGIIINASRSILYASGGPGFAEAAHRETLGMNALINQYLT